MVLGYVFAVLAALASGSGSILQSMGIRRAVTAIMFTTNTALSSLIGLTYLDDRVRAGFTAPAATGFALAIAGAIAVAHYAALARQTGASTTPGHDRVAT